MTINPFTTVRAASAAAIQESRNTQAAAQDGSTKTTAMGQDAFMQLLLTQLQHQDPTSPRADGEFLAQLAQFSQLEQLQQINEKLDALAGAFSLVDTTTTTESSTISGTVGYAQTAPAGSK